VLAIVCAQHKHHTPPGIGKKTVKSEQVARQKRRIDNPRYRAHNKKTLNSTKDNPHTHPVTEQTQICQPKLDKRERQEEEANLT
ncbi:hypothetical protein LW980_17915, partial [Erwinia amylovora]|uniref:hypothetical protein n=1 Tax=Erwinia amylovora TaxID=552 RepID=UPI0020BFB6EF